MEETTHIPPDLAAQTQGVIDSLFSSLNGVKALVVASIDGFSVAQRSSIAIDAHKVAAMASSFSALGVVVAEENHMGAKRVVTLEADGGYVILLDIPRADFPLVLSITASKDTILAQTLYLAREAIAHMMQTT
jgi:hypothetical protein